MLETLVAYLISKPAITFAGNLINKASEGAMDKLGEEIMGYLLKRYPKFGEQLQTAKQSSSQANKAELAQELTSKAKDDEELTKLISSLNQKLEEYGARIDNRKIVMGNEYSGNFTSQRDMNFGEVKNIQQTHSGSGDNVGGSKLMSNASDEGTARTAKD